MLELLSDIADEFIVDAFNDRLLFLLSFRSFSLLTLLSNVVVIFNGEELALIVLVSITAWRDGVDILRTFNSCLRSTKKFC